MPDTEYGMSKPTPTSDGASAARGLVGLAEARAAARLGLGLSERRECRALPDARRIVAQAVVGGEPAAVHTRAAYARAVRIVHRGIAHRETLAVGETSDHGLEGREVRGRFSIRAGDHGAARHAGRTEDVPRVRDVHTVHRDVEVTRHLIRHRVHDGVTELEVRRRRDVVQVADVELRGDRLAAALELEIHGAAHVVVDDLLERLELAHQLAVHAHQHVAGLQCPVRGTAGQHLVHDQHARERREGPARGFLGLLIEPQAPQLVVGCVVEHHLQRAARDRAAGLDHLEGTLHAPER
jgi:hypothetical protein